MSLFIRQCIPADRDSAAAFLQSQAAGVSAPPIDIAKLDLQSSLIATDGENIVGIALCIRFDPASESRQLSVIIRDDDADLLRTLVDKAMGKLASRGLHKCKVICVDGKEPAELWGASQWPPRAAVAAAV
ncbi:MAG: hypothetical protein WD768_16645 [Phycisphaeraceae bacterium]